MSTAEVFAGAGTVPGLEVWQIVEFEPRKVEPRLQGSFYSGDSYIVLYTDTVPGSRALCWNLHFWRGTSSSQVGAKCGSTRSPSWCYASCLAGVRLPLLPEAVNHGF